MDMFGHQSMTAWRDAMQVCATKAFELTCTALHDCNVMRASL
jgi:hypothetical protein